MTLWLQLSYAAMALSLFSLLAAHLSWALAIAIMGFSPRAFAAGAGLLLLYAIGFGLYHMIHRRE